METKKSSSWESLRETSMDKSKSPSLTFTPEASKKRPDSPSVKTNLSIVFDLIGDRDQNSPILERKAGKPKNYVA